MLHLIHTPDAYESHKDMRNVTHDLRGNLQVVVLTHVNSECRKVPDGSGI